MGVLFAERDGNFCDRLGVAVEVRHSFFVSLINEVNCRCRRTLYYLAELERSGIMTARRVAVVTGANRGIGLATVRALLKQFNGAVYLTSRNAQRGEDAVKLLKSEGISPKFHVLDTADQKSLGALKDHLVQEYGGVDVFVHNVGVMYHTSDPTPFPERAKVIVQTNYIDMVNVCNTFLPVMKPEGRLVILSSGLSMVAFRGCTPQLQKFFKSPDMTEDKLTAKMNEFVVSAQAGTTKQLGFDEHSYGISKLGVNVVTRILAKRAQQLESKNVLVNCCCPGWVRTSLGGDGATFSADQGAEIPVTLALIPEGSTEPNGEFYQRRKLVKWYS